MRRAAWRLNWICVRVAGVTGKPSESDVQEEQRSSFQHSLSATLYSPLIILYLLSPFFNFYIFFSIPNHFCLLFVSFLISPIRFFSVLSFKSSFVWIALLWEKKKEAFSPFSSTKIAFSFPHGIFFRTIMLYFSSCLRLWLSFIYDMIGL